ncbi:metal ion resistance protein/transporter (Zrc1), putative [Aspergillus lentulus]|uniref:Metal ion resistance protein/transporter (Zrc1), putative n=1 Tax=Aspergillus lentulus TaxID=293939 RepID=A0ABQ1AU39_ASPLE|nr:metal ion resistance protein/transporter (Zrc1), putative [Aspergillus lentulus]GFF88083.1 metal ion resistance protein/transporter (Zrc1), putative [Aspergillus lentulus]
MFSHLKREHRLILVISISASFFLAEIAVGFYTRSLALVADAFHYLNDLVGFIVALVALKISQRSRHPKELSFGWQRAQLLGAFFNGVFLLSLGISIFLQSIDRFVSLERIENPKLVLIVGCVGLALNLISGLFLHEHDHDHVESNTPGSSDNDLELSTPLSRLERRNSFSTRVLRPHVEHRHNVKSQAKKGHDLGMMGVLIHVLGDAANNLGVIIAALVIWKAKYDGRYYADPAVSMAIAIVILLSSLPLVRKSGTILLQSVPLGVDPEDVKHDLEAIPGVESVHELHIWQLNQEKALASVHLAVSNELIADFMDKAKIINECFHAYGIHSTTLQPEHVRPIPSDTRSIQGRETTELIVDGGVKKRHVVDPNSGCSSETLATCLINCGSTCEGYTCCSRAKSL